MKDTDRRLRVIVGMKLIIRSMDKEFNLSSNYPKGDGDAFKAFIKEHCPKKLLQHFKSVNNNRQDVVTESSGPMCYNLPLRVEYFDNRLRTYG